MQNVISYCCILILGELGHILVYFRPFSQLSRLFCSFGCDLSNINIDLITLEFTFSFHFGHKSCLVKGSFMMIKQYWLVILKTALRMVHILTAKMRDIGQKGEEKKASCVRLQKMRAQ